MISKPALNKRSKILIRTYRQTKILYEFNTNDEKMPVQSPTVYATYGHMLQIFAEDTTTSKLQG